MRFARSSLQSACDAERLARFQPEAQVLAAANHPNINQIYGLEGAGALYRVIVLQVGQVRNTTVL